MTTCPVNGIFDHPFKKCSFSRSSELVWLVVNNSNDNEKQRSVRFARDVVVKLHLSLTSEITPSHARSMTDHLNQLVLAAQFLQEFAEQYGIDCRVHMTVMAWSMNIWAYHDKFSLMALKDPSTLNDKWITNEAIPAILAVMNDIDKFDSSTGA